MKNILKQKIDRAFQLTTDLYSSFDEKDLKFKVPNLPSNTIGEQVWCIIGARESYTKAIKAGAWQGFACSLKDKFGKDGVLSKLEKTKEELDSVDFDSLSEESLDIAFDLLEHEIQHHGQLIRYVYGNKLKFPKSWNDRYTV